MVFEHEPVRDVSIEFGSRTAGGYDFTLRGTADIGWDEPLLQDVPILLQCDLPFTGVLVDEHKEPAARARLDAYFGPLQWGQPVVRNYQHLFPLRDANSLKVGDTGPHEELVVRENPDALRLVYIPSLEALLIRAEQLKGSSLTDTQRERIAAKAQVMAVTARMADAADSPEP